MKQPTREDKIIQQHFQQQKRKEQLHTPAFDKVFKKATQKYKTRRRIRLVAMAACITLLAIIGVNLNDSGLPNQIDQTTVVKGSTNLYARLMANGKIVTNDIHFEYDRAVIKPNSLPVIESLATMLKKHPAVKLSIEGHTDNTGATEYNQQLSFARAYQVKAALIRLGIQEHRLTSKGFGESKPDNTNETEQGRALNRRVEFVLIK